MKRVDTSEATRSRGAEGVGPPVPPEPGVTCSVVALISEGDEGEGRDTSWVQRGQFSDGVRDIGTGVGKW